MFAGPFLLGNLLSPCIFNKIFLFLSQGIEKSVKKKPVERAMRARLKLKLLMKVPCVKKSRKPEADGAKAPKPGNCPIKPQAIKD